MRSTRNRAEDLVAAAIAFTSGRRPTRQETAELVDRLAQGVPPWEVVRSVMDPPSADSANGREPAGPSPELRSPGPYADRVLVDAAFRAFFGRVPDPEGQEHYYALLQTGMSWQQFLLALMESKEWDRRALARLEAAGAEVVIPFRGLSDHAELTLPASDTSLLPGMLGNGGVWEPHVTAALSTLLSPGDTMIDVGANIGYFTVLASRLVGRSGHIFAFEPSPAARAALERNIKRNEICNATVFAEGLWSNDGELAFREEIEGLGASRILLGGGALTTHVGIPVRSLDSMRNEGSLDLQACSVIKMDIEGAEPWVIDGMHDTLERFHPILICELNPSLLRENGKSTAEFIAQLADHGYSAYVIPQAHQESALADAAEVMQVRPGLNVFPVEDAWPVIRGARPQEVFELLAMPVDCTRTQNRPRRRDD